jgi:hypothetical protein
MRRAGTATTAHQFVDREPFQFRLDSAGSGSPLLSREISWVVKWMKHQIGLLDDATIILGHFRSHYKNFFLSQRATLRKRRDSFA